MIFLEFYRFASGASFFSLNWSVISWVRFSSCLRVSSRGIRGISSLLGWPFYRFGFIRGGSLCLISDSVWATRICDGSNGEGCSFYFIVW